MAKYNKKNSGASKSTASSKLTEYLAQNVMPALKEIAKKDPKTLPYNEEYIFATPCNYDSGHAYRGTNLLLLTILPLVHPEICPPNACEYITFYSKEQHNKERLANGESELIRFKDDGKGKGVPILYYGVDHYVREIDGKKETIKASEYNKLSVGEQTSWQPVCFAKVSHVFSIGLFDNIQSQNFDVRYDKSEYNEQSRFLIDKWKSIIPVKEGDTNIPHYNLKTKEIHMPRSERFYSTDGELAVMFHEMTHSVKGAEGYTIIDNSPLEKNPKADELVAEMGAICLFQRTHGGISAERLQNSLVYISGWFNSVAKEYSDTESAGLLEWAMTESARRVDFILNETQYYKMYPEKQTAEDSSETKEVVSNPTSYIQICDTSKGTKEELITYKAEQKAGENGVLYVSPDLYKDPGTKLYSTISPEFNNMAAKHYSKLYKPYSPNFDCYVSASEEQEYDDELESFTSKYDALWGEDNTIVATISPEEGSDYIGAPITDFSGGAIIVDKKAQRIGSLALSGSVEELIFENPNAVLSPTAIKDSEVVEVTIRADSLSQAIGFIERNLECMKTLANPQPMTLGEQDEYTNGDTKAGDVLAFESNKGIEGALTEAAKISIQKGEAQDDFNKFMQKRGYDLFSVQNAAGQKVPLANMIYDQAQAQLNQGSFIPNETTPVNAVQGGRGI